MIRASRGFRRIAGRSSKKLSGTYRELIMSVYAMAKPS